MCTSLVSGYALDSHLTCVERGNVGLCALATPRALIGRTKGKLTGLVIYSKMGPVVVDTQVAVLR